jgi:hypothetical protein
MASLSEEVRHVQNPALGAMLEWQFVVGHTESRQDASGCPLPLLFLVLPMLLHQETLQYVESTQRRTGLRGFAAKFARAESGDSDVLLALHERAAALRGLSLQSMRVAIRAQLVTVDLDVGVAFELSRTMPRVGVAERVRILARSAKKLGQWCGELTVIEISTVLRVRF